MSCNRQPFVTYSKTLSNQCCNAKRIFSTSKRVEGKKVDGAIPKSDPNVLQSGYFLRSVQILKPKSMLGHGTSFRAHARSKH